MSNAANESERRNPSELTAEQLGVEVVNLNMASKIVQLCMHAGLVPILVGESGTGKTAMMQQLAKLNGAECLVYALSVKEPQDIAGLPFPNSDDTYSFKRDGRIPAQFIPPRADSNLYRRILFHTNIDRKEFEAKHVDWSDRFQALLEDVASNNNVSNAERAKLEDAYLNALDGEEESRKPCVLFFDELNRASRPVFNAAFSVWNERRFGDHVLGENVVLAAAQNPSGGAYATASEFTSDPAMRRRLCWIVVEVDAAEHRAYRTGRNGADGLKLQLPKIGWGERIEVPKIPYHPAVLGFLSGNESALRDIDAQQAGKVYGCGATWEAVSRLCYVAEALRLDLSKPATKLLMKHACAGFVGMHQMLAFLPVLEESLTAIDPAAVLRDGLGEESMHRMRIQALLDQDDFPSIAAFIEQLAQRAVALSEEEREALSPQDIVDVFAVLLDILPLNLGQNLLDTYAELRSTIPHTETARLEFIHKISLYMSGNAYKGVEANPSFEAFTQRLMDANNEGSSSLRALSK